eukprot:s262_g13.t1
MVKREAVRYAAAPRPHQQALLPMPTFGQQPMAIVAGQVVDAGVDDEGVVQGRIERGPWHETLRPQTSLLGTS